MSAIFQMILTGVSGALIGALCFGLYFMFLMYIYIFLYGYFSINLLIFSSVTLDKPILAALTTGFAIGSVLGLFTGLTTGMFGVNTILKCMTIGIIVTAIFLSGFFILSSGTDMQNPIEFILVLVTDIPSGLIKNFWLFIPSAATGAILARVISFTTSK
jgi:hypothetical protein